MLNEEEMLNRTIDFTFAHHYKGRGHWGNQAKFSIDVPNKAAIAIPEKEAMVYPGVANILVSDIKRKKK